MNNNRPIHFSLLQTISSRNNFQVIGSRVPTIPLVAIDAPASAYGLINSKVGTPIKSPDCENNFEGFTNDSDTEASPIPQPKESPQQKKTQKMAAKSVKPKKISTPMSKTEAVKELPSRNLVEVVQEAVKKVLPVDAVRNGIAVKEVPNSPVTRKTKAAARKSAKVAPAQPTKAVEEEPSELKALKSLKGISVTLATTEVTKVVKKVTKPGPTKKPEATGQDPVPSEPPLIVVNGTPKAANKTAAKSASVTKGSKAVAACGENSEAAGTATVDGYYICRLCDFKSKSKPSMRFHSKAHEVQPLKVMKKIQLNKDRDDSAKVFRCDTCDYSSMCKDRTRRHMRTHTGEKPFGCPYCDKKSIQKEDVVQHIRSRHPSKDHLPATPIHYS